jgi:hypothetical protein
MKNYDVKHIAYHALVAIYFIWFLVFAMLLAVSLGNYYGEHNRQLTKILMAWIFLNLVMGTALFIVIQQFRKQTALSRVIVFGYFLMVAASVTVVLILL